MSNAFFYLVTAIIIVLGILLIISNNNKEYWFKEGFKTGVNVLMKATDEVTKNLKK
mgnify:CR=1 FL=1